MSSKKERVTYDSLCEDGNISRPTLGKIIPKLKIVNEMIELQDIAEKNGWSLEWTKITKRKVTQKHQKP